MSNINAEDTAKKVLNSHKQGKAPSKNVYNTKPKKVSQFRNSQKAKGHLSYVYRKEGEILEFLSMTHQPPEEDKSKYRQLTKSVDPNDTKTTYINTQSDKDHFLNFGSKKKGFAFAEEDKKMVRKIIKANKKSEN